VQVWPPLIFDLEMEDMEEFIGYGELGLHWRSAQSGRWYGNVELGARARKGAAKAITRGAVILEGAWNPHYGPTTAQIWRFMPYLFAQFFTGYYESLSTYDVMQTHFRVGVGLTDLADASH
jgi:outer membrane phospholipase A